MATLGDELGRGRDAFQKVAARACGADRCACFPCDLLDGHRTYPFPFRWNRQRSEPYALHQAFRIARMG